MNGYELVVEATSTYLYHSSNIQGIKILEVMTLTSSSRLPGKFVYASNDLAYASAFCFRWEDRDGVDVKKRGNIYTIEIPRKLKSRTLQPASMYILHGSTFKDANPKGLEFVSRVPVKPLKETRYDTALKCMSDNDLKVKWI